MDAEGYEPLARTLKARRPEPLSPMLGALAELPEPVLICRAVAGNLTVTFANPACHAVLGLTRDARLDGEPLVVLLGAWLTETALESLRRAILLRRSFALPLERTLEDGTLRRVQLNLRVTGQDSGALWVGSLKPVDASPALTIEGATLVSTGAGRELRLSRRLRAEPEVLGVLIAALDAVPACVGVRARDGHYEYANGLLAELLGLTPATLVSTPSPAAESRIAGPDEWPDIAARVLDARETVGLPGRVVADALGRERLLDVRFAPLGTTGYVLELTTDAAAVRAEALNASDSSQLEAEAATERQNARALYASLPVMLLSVDTEGTILDANEACLDKLGYARGDLLGRALGALVRPADGIGGTAGDLWSVLQDGLQGFRCTLCRADGQPLEAALSVHVSRDRNGHASSATLCFLEHLAPARA